jgi:hypothetical protein
VVALRVVYDVCRMNLVLGAAIIKVGTRSTETRNTATLGRIRTGYHHSSSAELTDTSWLSQTSTVELETRWLGW